MKVREFMTAQVVAAKPTDTVEDVARMMSEIDSGAIPVIEDDLVIGMITDRDIVIRVIAERKDGFTPVSEVMTQGVESCLEDDDIAEAARRMAELQMRRLVVFNSEGELSGIISLGDIAIEHQGNLATEALEEISQDE
ncbi:CBS domain-containing protein [Rhizobium sp. BE258]|jgi:CBS domain-containing protein|uniref:CBS domain-containing protein n=1 Tax=Rhizobium sp. BE258 TaxID=2817722 RepID=UPI000DD9355E|nr:CBS domain-containing protein [Rhizobium sp. BE258]MDR7145067.1 CBS domain-containing protein [Rhizobium sp. BE258]